MPRLFLLLFPQPMTCLLRTHSRRRPATSVLLGVLPLFAAVALCPQPVQAQSLVTGPGGVSVTADDIRSAMQRIPAASREATLSRPETVRRQAEDLYLRRMLAVEAERDGLVNDPAVVTALRQARDRVLSDARLAAIDKAAVPPDSEVTRYARDLYRENPERFRTPEQTRASHILISRSDDGKARERAQALLAEIKKGASFETLAREQSADGASATRGGDLGWFGPGQMVKPFEDAVASIRNPGELSDIVETQFGFHIVRLDGRRPAGVRTFEEVRDDLEREVRAKAEREARLVKMREMMRDAKVDTDAIEAFTRQHQTQKP